MTTNLPEEAQRRTAFAYNAASDSYDKSPLGSGTISAVKQLNGFRCRLDRLSSMFVAGLELLRFLLRNWWDHKERS
jgi:hypothetical protein